MAWVLHKTLCKLKTERKVGCVRADLLVEVLAILLIGGVASGMRSWLFDSAASRVMARLRSRLFTSLMAQEIGVQPSSAPARP